MFARLRPRLNHATVVAYVALFVALGGTGYATTQLHPDASQDQKMVLTLSVPEGFHKVGAAGQPRFQNSWTTYGGAAETVAFYKDRGGVVHLKGAAKGGAPGTVIFQLPAGYRPASGKTLDFAAVCSCSTTDYPGADAVSLPTGVVEIAGPSTYGSGAVRLRTGGSSYVILDGITFRAAS